MSEQTPQGDEYWRKVLQPAAYAALRQGVMEAPFSGPYHANTKIGTYRCIGCGSVLFSSEDTIQNGSGFLTATDVVSQAVTLNKYWRISGEEYSRLICTTCGGAVGETEDMEILSAEDLETGTRKRTYFINSNAVTFSAALVPKNYPVASVLIAVVILIVSTVFYYVGSNLMRSNHTQDVAAIVPLWVTDHRVDAKSVVFSGSNHPIIVQDSFGSHDTLFLILPKQPDMTIDVETITPQATVSWLDENHVVLSSVVLKEEGETLTVPWRARYAYVSRKSDSIRAIPKVGQTISKITDTELTKKGN